MTFCSEVGNYRPELLIVIEEKLFTWREERWFKTATFFFFFNMANWFCYFGIRDECSNTWSVLWDRRCDFRRSFFLTLMQGRKSSTQYTIWYLCIKFMPVWNGKFWTLLNKKIVWVLCSAFIVYHVDTEKPWFNLIPSFFPGRKVTKTVWCFLGLITGNKVFWTFKIICLSVSCSEGDDEDG